MKKEITVEGMKCAGCANTVREKFEAIEGVEVLEADHSANKVIIESTVAINNEILVDALSSTNYSVITDD